MTRYRFPRTALHHTPADPRINADRLMISFFAISSQSPHDHEADDLRLTLIPLVDTSIGAFGV
jgi:hypothetical protein